MLSKLARVASISLFAMLPLSTTEVLSEQMFFGAFVEPDNRCVIRVQQTGTLVAEPGGNQLSSLLAGGSPGIAEVISRRNYEIWVDAPGFFQSGPAGANDNVTHTAYFAGRALNQRGLDFPMREGSLAVQTPRRRSRTEITVDLVSDRPDPFPAGDYTAVAIIRCE